MRSTLASITVILTLGVLPASAAAAHDVPWYAGHPAARAARLATCTANPGDLAHTPDCINAETAAQRATIAGL